MATIAEILIELKKTNKYSGYSDYALKKGRKKEDLELMAKEEGINLENLGKNKSKVKKQAKVDLAITSDRSMLNQGSTFSQCYQIYQDSGDINVFYNALEKMIIVYISKNDIVDDDKIYKVGSTEHETFMKSFIQELEKINATGNKRNRKCFILKFLKGQNSVYPKLIEILKMDIGILEKFKLCFDVLRKYILVHKSDVKQYGEVTTPFELVDEMLDTLPKEVWSNPNLKWLDPANGIGPYPLHVILRLMEGLKEWEPNDGKRFQYILENMIYVCELQEINMFLWLFIINSKETYKVNFYCGSFLEDGFDLHMKNVWKVDKFDLVIGNPPFNQMIDMDFIKKSYVISDKVLIVHPSTWLLDEKGKQNKFISTKELIKNDLESIKLFNGNKIFNIALFVPCVVTYINKFKLNSNIKCIDEVNNVSLEYENINQINKFSNIDEYSSIKEKVLNKGLNKNLNSERILNTKKSTNNTPSKKSKYEALNTIGEFYINIAQIRGNVNKEEGNSMIKDDFYTIVSKDNKVERIIDNHMFYKFTSQIEADNFLNYLKTNFVRFCLSIYKNNSQLDRGEMELIPYLDYTKNWTDIELYKLYDLSEKEIEFIERFIPKYY